MPEDVLIIPDRRYHQLPDGSFVPRVTSITGMWPKGEFYERWLGDSVSYDAACEYRDKTAASGTKIHDLISQTIIIKMNDGTCGLYLEDGVAQLPGRMSIPCSLSEWQKILSFAQFMKDWKVRPVEVEHFMFSDELKTAGTADLFAYATDPKDKTGTEKFYCIDWKTGTAIHHGHKIQVMMYGVMHDVVNDQDVTDGLIVRLGSQHKCGYEVQKISIEDTIGLLNDWNACYHLFERESGLEPKPKSFPLSVTL